MPHLILTKIGIVCSNNLQEQLRKKEVLIKAQSFIQDFINYLNSKRKFNFIE